MYLLLTFDINLHDTIRVFFNKSKKTTSLIPGLYDINFYLIGCHYHLMIQLTGDFLRYYFPKREAEKPEMFKINFASVFLDLNPG